MGLFHSASVVRSGLVLHLDAANPKSYPGTGSTWFDLSGKNNHAAITGTPIGNGTTNFTGTSSYATVPFDAVDFTFDFEQTIMIALRPTENDGIRRNPYDQAYGGGGTWTHETNGTINYIYGTAGTNSVPYAAISSGAVNQNEWAIVSSVRNSTANFVRWYKNGGLSVPGTSAYPQITTGTQPIKIGTGYAGSYVGNIDVVLVYNKALTTEQVNQNFEALRGRYGI